MRDLFIRVISDDLDDNEIEGLSFEGFSVYRGRAADDSCFLVINTGLGDELTIEWDGSIVEALRTIIDAAVTAAQDVP